MVETVKLLIQWLICNQKNLESANKNMSFIGDSSEHDQMNRNMRRPGFQFIKQFLVLKNSLHLMFGQWLNGFWFTWRASDMNLPRCIRQTQCIPKNHLVKKTSISLLQGPRVPLFLESVRKLQLRMPMSTSAGDQCFLCMKTKCQQLSNIVKLVKPLTPYWVGQLEQSSALSFFETLSFVWQVAGWLCRLGWQFWQTSWDIEEHFPTSVLQLNFKWLCSAMSIVKNATHVICSYSRSSYHAII